MNRDDLYDRFIDLCHRLNPKANPKICDGWFDILAGLYSDPARHYHTLDHVAFLLEALDGKTGRDGWMEYHLEVETAIWFHDAIYNVPSIENEQRSALLAVQFLGTIGVESSPDDAWLPLEVSPDAFSRRVTHAIRATVHDGKWNGGGAAQLICDLDLLGFARDWDEFNADNQKIREEFWKYSDEEYRWGRVKFLSGLLGRQIFYVLNFEEDRARENIKRHIADLVAGR